MMAVSREATFRRKEGEETPRVRKRHSFSLASPCDALAASASRALPLTHRTRLFINSPFLCLQMMDGTMIVYFVLWGGGEDSRCLPA